MQSQVDKVFPGHHPYTKLPVQNVFVPMQTFFYLDKANQGDNGQASCYDQTLRPKHTLVRQDQNIETHLSLLANDRSRH